MAKTRAFAYLRVSGKGQVKGDGFPRQIAAIRNYAAHNGIQIIQVFEEKAVRGAETWENRPAWSAMVQNLNGVRSIIIERLDRLARDLMVQEHIIADLRRRDIALISVAEPDLCVDDPSRKLLRQIVGAVAEYDRAMVVLKLRGARQRMKEATGRCEGRKPYGDKPGEAEVRDRIRSMRAGGATYKSICDALNAEGVPTRHGGQWQLMTVRKIALR